MNVLTHSDSSETQWLGEVLSADPDKQRVELSFLQRLLRLTKAEADKGAAAGKSLSVEREFKLAQDRIQNPIFGVLSRALEARLPAKIRLGRFQDKD